MKRSVLFLFMAAAVGSVYGRSIQELIDQDGQPRVSWWEKRLNLSDKNINDLSGFENIRGIGKVRMLRLDGNKISTIPKSALVAAKNLYVLNLSSNELTAEGLKGLAGLESLRALVLDSNKIEDIPQEALEGLPKLTFVIIRGNPITAEKIAALRKQGLYVYTLPVLTREHMKKAGVISAAVVALILAAVGTVKTGKYVAGRGVEAEKQKVRDTYKRLETSYEDETTEYRNLLAQVDAFDNKKKQVAPDGELVGLKTEALTTMLQEAGRLENSSFFVIEVIDKWLYDTDYVSQNLGLDNTQAAQARAWYDEFMGRRDRLVKAHRNLIELQKDINEVLQSRRIILPTDS